MSEHDEDPGILRLDSGPNPEQAKEWARLWEVAVRNDTDAFRRLLPTLEGIQASCLYGKRFSLERIYSWLKYVDPFTLVEAMEKLPVIDYRLRLDSHGLIAYMQGYVDGYSEAQTEDYEHHKQD